VLPNHGTVTISNPQVKALSISIGAGSVPTSFALSQNYPNPFNPSTRFNVDVPRQSIVSINVYNILGQKVAALLNGPVSAGSHEVIWSATDGHGNALPSGTYFVRMTADGFSAVQKVMLMK
jgi:hypothetical protein